MRMTRCLSLQSVMAATVLLCCTAAGAPQSAPAEGWPGLWGPNRNATVSTAVPQAPTPRQLWRRPAAGGYSEIAVAGSRAITMELRDGADFVVALDASTGKELWSAPVGPTYKGHDGSDDGPIATPAIDGTDVFAVGPHGVLLALDLGTGKERWRHDLVAEFGARVPTWGFASSPLIEGRLVIVPTGGGKSRGLLAFERASGRLAWSGPGAKSTDYSSAVAATLAGARQILVATGERVFAVSAADGRELWSAPGHGVDKEVTTSPIVLPGDRVLITTFEQSWVLEVTGRNGAFAVAEAWRSSRLRPGLAPTVYRDGFLYTASGGQLVCVDAATGAERWRERIGEATLIGAGPRLLVLSNASGMLSVVDAAPGGFRETFRTQVLAPGTRAVTGPSFAGGRVYVRNLKEIAAFALGG